MKSIDRRTCLRGVGAAIALPWLDAMASPLVAGARPTRMAFLFVPNGVNPSEWMPTAGSTALPRSLAALDGVREHVTIHTGLSHRNASALGDGPGDHARSAACFLTGAHPRKTSGSDIMNGVSVDQVAAQHFKHDTRFASLELGCERGATGGSCDSGYSCAYSANISWRTPRTPVSKEISPRLAFERLFAVGPVSESASARAERLHRRRSILDGVADDSRRLRARLGSRDQHKLADFLESVRELERRIEFVEEREQDPTDLTLESLPRGLPGDHGEHIDLMGEIMALAFEQDLTRVVSFMWANEGSNRSFASIGVRDGHHHLSHHGKDEAKVASIQAIDRFHIERLAVLIARLNRTRDQDGRTTLDDTALVFGSAISDGNRHNHNNLPIIVAGGGGGATPGGVIEHEPNTPLCNLYLSMLHSAGIEQASFGDSTGEAKF